MSAHDPLAARIYLRRCWRRVFPSWLVMVLVTILLLLLLTPTNTFRETSEANMKALEALTVVGPARGRFIDPDLLTMLDRNPEVARRLAARASWVRYPMLVGEAFCALILVSEEEIPELLRRSGVALARGRLPRVDSAEIVLHEDVARARGITIGDRIGSFVDPDDATPGVYRVAGLLRGRARLAVGALGRSGLFESVLGRAPMVALLYPRPGRKPAMDATLHAARDRDGPLFQVIDAAYMKRRIARALENLPLLLGLVGAASSLVVALVVTLLDLITFQARADEFAILLVMGHERGRLVRKLAAERALQALTSWGTGLALGTVALLVYQQGVFEPRGISVRIPDLQPILISGLIPLASLGSSVVTLVRRLRSMDPVAVVQRRTVA